MPKIDPLEFERRAARVKQAREELNKAQETRIQATQARDAAQDALDKESANFGEYVDREAGLEDS